jgi:uncharacterized protein YigA (DUF484 family)
MPTNETQAEISWEEAVSRFLADNPDFFVTHPELLADITVPHTETGLAVSLIERQVGVLRDQNRQLDRQLRELISNAKENEVITRRLHDFAKGLLVALDECTLVDVATSQVKDTFHLDAATLRVASNDSGGVDGSIWLETDDEQLAQLALLVATGNPVCGSFLDEEQKLFLFGEDRDKIKSCALIPIKAEELNGIYCLGSQDPHRFDKEMATDYLARLGDLIASALLAQRSNT